MRLAVIGLAILLTFPLCAPAAADDSQADGSNRAAQGMDPSAQSVDLSATVAAWDGGTITVQDYVDWWRYLPEGDRTPLVTMEEKLEFLDNMINAKLMLAAAESLGIDKDPMVVEFSYQRRAGMLQEALFTDATDWRIDVSDAAVDEVVDRRRTQANITRIIVPTREAAVAIIDSVRAGVPMEDLARRHSTCPTYSEGGKMGPIRWGDLNDYWSHKVFSLEEGEISRPFSVDGGYAVVRMESKLDVSVEDPEAERETIRAMLEQQKALEERAAYVDSLRAAYSYVIHDNAVYDLCAKYALALLKQGETRQVIDTDVIPDFAPGEENTPMVSFSGWTFTSGDCVNEILRMPYQARPALDQPNAMFTLVARITRDSLLMAEAVKLGYDERPEISMELEKVRRRKSTLLLFNYLTRDAVVPEDSLRAFYETYKDNFVQREGYRYYKMLLESRSTADSIMVLLDGGGDFAAIAREISLDPFTAPRGGLVTFQAVGADTEFDGFFSAMDAGETRYFVSLEGHVILRLMEKLEPKPSTFEEARSTIENRLRPDYRNRMLKEWLETQRSRRNMKVNEEILGAISLGA